MWSEPIALVGRERDLARLRDALASAAEGRGGVALVSGEAGIGKTRLLYELAQGAQRDGWRVLFGRAYEVEGRPPYLPVLEPLRDALRTLARLDLRLHDTVAPELIPLLPELASHVDPVVSTVAPGLGDQLDAARDRFRLFDSIGDVVFALATTAGPGLLLVVDDLHWSDPPTLQLVLHIARKLNHVPVLLVCAYRAGPPFAQPALHGLLAELARVRLYQRIDLPALTRSEVHSLVTSLGSHAAPAVLDIIHRQTGGNPFFVSELLRHLCDRGYEPGRGELANAEWGVPESVHHVVGMRLSSLTSTAIDLLQASSVLGDPLHPGVLAAMLTLEPAVLLDSFEEVVRSGLVREEGDHYQFSHALVRETVYRGLPLSRRQRLHRAAVTALEHVYPSALERHLGELAVHAAHAGILIEPHVAIDYAERAGAAASAVFAYEQAATHWRAALQQMEEHGASAENRAGVLERLGVLLYEAGIDYAEGIVNLEQALDLYTQLDQPLHAARLHARLGNALASMPETWDVPRAVEHYRRAEAGLMPAGPSPELGSVYVGIAQVAIWTVDIAAGLDASSRALNLAEELDDERLWARAAAVRGGHLCSTGAVDEGLPLMHAAWRTSDRLNDPSAFFAAFLGSAFAHWLGDAVEFKRWCERELGRPRLQQAPGQRQRFVARLAAAHALMGELDAARALLDTVAESYDAWEALFWLGDWETCVTLASQRVADSHSSGDRAFAFEATYDLARVRHAQGDTASAVEHLERALDVAASGGERAYELAVRCLLADWSVELGNVTQARTHLGRAHAIADLSDQWRGLSGHLALADGVVTLAEGLPELAKQHFAQASAVFRHFACPWAEAEAQLAWGRGLQARAEHSSADQRLHAAAEIYRRYGASAAWLARVAAVKQLSDGSAVPASLSDREIQVLRLLAVGRSNRQIAQELVISLNTVASHVSHVFAKIGAANRAEASSYAYRHGIV